MMREELLDNIRYWQARIGEAAAPWGGAEICAVSKTINAQTINMAWDGGIRTLGENRVQELLGKIDALNPDYQIHLIGQLQTNKVKPVIGRVSMIQSLDRDALAVEISRRCVEAGQIMPVTVQVNIAREPQKAGISEEALLPFLRRTAELPGLKIMGLMAIMPIAQDPEALRPYFKGMRRWFERLRDMDLPGVEMKVLSMGMSGDCIVAAEEGATMVRLGRALFGPPSCRTGVLIAHVKRSVPPEAGNPVVSKSQMTADGQIEVLSAAPQEENLQEVHYGSQAIRRL